MLTKKTVVIYLINVCEIKYRYLRIVSDMLKLQLQVEYEINTDGYNMLFVKYD